MELGFQHVNFEGDFEGVMKSLAVGDFTYAVVGHLVKDFKSIVGSFRTYSISRIRRHGNNVANALARGARFSFPLQVWMEEVPPDIYHFVVKDFPIQ